MSFLWLSGSSVYASIDMVCMCVYILYIYIHGKLFLQISLQMGKMLAYQGGYYSTCNTCSMEGGYNMAVPVKVGAPELFKNSMSMCINVHSGILCNPTILGNHSNNQDTHSCWLIIVDASP